MESPAYPSSSDASDPQRAAAASVVEGTTSLHKEDGDSNEAAARSARMRNLALDLFGILTAVLFITTPFVFLLIGLAAFLGGGGPYHWLTVTPLAICIIVWPFIIRHERRRTRRRASSESNVMVLLEPTKRRDLALVLFGLVTAALFNATPIAFGLIMLGEGFGNGGSYHWLAVIPLTICIIAWPFVIAHESRRAKRLIAQESDATSGDSGHKS
jgi:hypothetical protein